MAVGGGRGKDGNIVFTHEILLRNFKLTKSNCRAKWWFNCYPVPPKALGAIPSSHMGTHNCL